MRNLLITPAPRSDDIAVEAADWAEINALFKASRIVSSEDLAGALFREGTVGKNRSRVISGDAFNELADRSQSCGVAEHNRYPFELDSTGTLLSLRQAFRLNSNFGLLYWFLLFISRADMSSRERTLAGIDPTKVFEQVCADVLADFWGGRSAFSGAMVVGTTSANRQFQSRIDNLCASIGVGIGWKPGAKAPGGGDAKVDVAAWRRFADNRQGGLVGFAQCKTGVHWKDHLTKLRPETFCFRFFREQPLVIPLRLYMVPHRIVSHRWDEHTTEGGVLLDRSRVLQYAGSISPHTLMLCKKWLQAAYRRQRSHRVTL
jgi:hypothetical protein